MTRQLAVAGLVLGSALSGLPACAGAPRPRSPHPAELVLRHAAVYTVDAVRSWAEAVAVERGRIVFVGTDAQARAWIGPRTRVVDLAGKMVLPGFQDSHVHLVEGGVQLGECALGDFTTAEQVLSAVAQYAAEHPRAEWIRGSGWALPLFPEANPSRLLLDQAAPGRAIALEAADGHSLWVSTRGLELAGITRETPDPPNGRIERDPRTGVPTGTPREAASQRVRKVLPPHSAAERAAGLRRGLELAASVGITSIEDASASEEVLAAYRDLDRRGELTLRVAAALHVEPGRPAGDEVRRLRDLQRRYRGRRLRPIAAKIFADGVIEAKTAALLEPYVGGTDRGPANWTPQELDGMVSALDRAGFEVHVHAIGDRAVRMALDAFERARGVNGVRDSRHQIAHLELIDPQDIPRFRRLGVVADFQPLWAYADSYIRELTVPVLGEARSQWLYPLGSVAQTAAVLTCGSDWNVTSMNPLEAIQVGVTRRDPASAPGPAWLPEQRVGLAEMIACYTIHGAYTAFQEKETGSIEVGKAADLVVLDRNLFEVPEPEIAKVQVLWTLSGGRQVFRRPGLAP